MCIFSDKTYRTWHNLKSDITYQFPLQGHLFALSLVSFFSDHEQCHPTFQFQFQFPRHVFKITMPWKAISPHEKRLMNDIQDGEASTGEDCSREHVEPVLPVRKITFWIERTLVSNTPFRRPSCQAREEKSKFSPTANSLRHRHQRSRTWATAQRALAEERKWRPKVHQARRDDHFSSRFLSLLLTAAIVPTRPTPLLLCSPLPLSLSISPTRCDAFKDVIVWIVHNMLPILGEHSRHLGYRPVYVGFPYDL